MIRTTVEATPVATEVWAKIGPCSSSWSAPGGSLTEPRPRRFGFRSSLRLYPEDDGYKVSGWLTGESGSVVIRALRQESRVVVEEQGLSGTTRGAGEHHTGSSVVDLWGHGERNARSLVRILRRVLKNNRRSSAGPVSFRDTTPIRRPVLWVEPERDAQRKPNVATGFG